MYLSKLSVRGLRASADSELEVRLPGRFAVLVGANSSGKTTFSDAAYLGHGETFPALGRFSAASLGSGERGIDVECRLQPPGAAEGPLGIQLISQSGALQPGDVAATWRKTLSRNLGTIRSQWDQGHELASAVKLIYLPAQRNPIDELARREARILVELLRAQQQRLDKTRNLTGLRARAWGLLEALSADPLIQAVEERVTAHLNSLTAGVARQWPYVRGQRVDDAYLARVLELMLSVLEGRSHARPLDVSGLGYVNLLHIAVTLAAIPDPSTGGSLLATTVLGDGAASATDETTTDAVNSNSPVPDVSDADQARGLLAQAREEAEIAEDSFFQEAPFHATVLIEEPEAHLHPQLQHALVRHLRRTVADRPELQVVLSSHAPDVITSALPEDIVVLRRLGDGRHVSRSVAMIPLKQRDDVLRKARLHLDSSRTTSLFAERLVLVEGVTEVAVLRELAWVWASEDLAKQAFIDALTIVAMGTRVGPWPVRLLATRDHELCHRLAVLSDSDKELDEIPTPPAWVADHDPDVVQVFHSHPTLEPALTPGNEDLVRAALDAIGVAVADPLTVESVRDAFRSARAQTATRPASPAGPAARKKGEFALAFAERIVLAREQGTEVTVPAHINDMLFFLYPSPASPSVPDDQVDIDDNPAGGSSSGEMSASGTR
ncbi:AAA family ATPase [Nocardia sp. NBC_00565]|uniref:ATP-dependent nuclease n=1 Tax=Nocardia sp. NBC_00565 TaxID=2975993 RepID=UPI002E801C21|nr:AAA family ATPase [Nocardia sp. NBC_00565]WUC02002.1 AAA family ATPase [Nocardia sp. NBC_00565]